MFTKKLFVTAWLLIVCLFIVALIVPRIVYAVVPIDLQAKSAILMNMNDGRILFSKNPDKPIQPASLTKVLSLYLVYEAINEGNAHLNDMVSISRNAWKTGGSKMFLKAGRQIPLEDLMKGMAIASGNDACVAVAEHFGGVNRFVVRMNTKARQLGMTHSTFKNPNGLPAKGQITTARDVLLLSSKYLERFPEALSIHSMPYFTHDNITQINHNRLLQRYPDVDGLKTGFVSAAGFHVIATAKRGDIRLIAVVMGSRNPAIRTRETHLLLEEGFKMIENESQKIRKIDVGYKIEPLAPS
jgi:D-alanyl-D-alanine carboxypeptidase (penicillin-binding protein 5/6)